MVRSIIPPTRVDFNRIWLKTSVDVFSEKKMMDQILRKNQKTLAVEAKRDFWSIFWKPHAQTTREIHAERILKVEKTGYHKLQILELQHLKWRVFAVRKCAQNGYREKVTINSSSLTTSWNWDQKWKIRNWPWMRGDNAWRGHQWQHVHNCPWLLGDTARCEHQWQHDHFHWLPHCLSVSAHCSVSSCVLARHISRTRTVAQVMSL